MNSTQDEMDWWERPYWFSSGVVLSLISVATIFGNSLTILAVYRVAALRTCTNFLVVSLASADLMVGVCVAPVGAAVQFMAGRWALGYWACHVWHAVDVLASTASILNLCVISLDRLLAVSRPIRYGHVMTGGRCGLAISAVWLLSALVSFPAIHLWHQFNLAQGPLRNDVCLFTDHRLYRILSSLISFYIPFILMTFAYARVYQTARRQLNTISRGLLHVKLEAPQVNGMESMRVHRGAHVSKPNSSTPANSPVRPKPGQRKSQAPEPPPSYSLKFKHLIKEHKAAKTLAIVFGVFVLCWLPFFTLNVLQAVTGPWSQEDPGTGNPGIEVYLFDLFTLLGYANSSVNPVIYAVSNLRFRHAFKRLLGMSSDRPEWQLARRRHHPPSSNL